MLKQYATDQSLRDQVLGRLERFVIRRVLSAEETKSFNKMCRDFITNPDALLVALSETSDEKVLSGLKNMRSNKNAALVLFSLELHRRSKDNKFDTSELKYNYSLEHIMPQKWEEYWKQVPQKKKLDGKLMNNEEAKNNRYDKIYWLGNLTLLTSSLKFCIEELWV